MHADYFFGGCFAAVMMISLPFFSAKDFATRRLEYKPFNWFNNYTALPVNQVRNCNLPWLRNQVCNSRQYTVVHRALPSFGV